MPRKRKQQVPGVLWRLFHRRARTLSETIISLIPSPPHPAYIVFCKSRRCLGCSSDARSFLLRPDDPSDYRQLLENCYVVVSENAQPIRFFIPSFHCHQKEVLLHIKCILFYLFILYILFLTLRISV
jgi:telomerase reverse transcriptase